MRAGTESFASGGKQIYTLAQSGTQKQPQNSQTIIVTGKGTDIKDTEVLAKRAKRKVVSRKMILALVDVAKEKGETDRVRAYWRAYRCQSEVVVSAGRLHTKFCKTRYCTVCNAIRKAEMINRYYPVIAEWEDVQFVTLTVKSCKEEKLNRWIFGMKKAFRQIRERCNKRYQRGKGIKLIGVKSLECNFNPIKKTYNPHYHLIVPNREIADLLKKEWLRQWRPKDKSVYRYKFTDPQAQDIKKVTSLNHSIKETIKYGSKIFTEPDGKKKRKNAKPTIPPKIYANALDNILAAMKGYRIFDRFGFNLPHQLPKERTFKLVENYETWLFPKDATDWVNPETGEALTGYLPPLQLSYLLNDCIDKKLC